MAMTATSKALVKTGSAHVTLDTAESVANSKRVLIVVDLVLVLMDSASALRVMEEKIAVLFCVPMRARIMANAVKEFAIVMIYLQALIVL